MAVLSFFIGILILLFLITLHEFGHFLVAKLFKVYVYEFSIGFGPKLFSWNGKETQYTIRLIPFGGYVYLASDFIDPPKNKENVEINSNRYLESLKRPKRLIIVFAGILMNFTIAVVLFTSIFSIIGYAPNHIYGYGAKYDTDINSPSASLGLSNISASDPYVITKYSFVHSDSKATLADAGTFTTINTNQNLLNFYQTAIKFQDVLDINKVDAHGSKLNTIYFKFKQYDHLHQNLMSSEMTTPGYFYSSDTKYQQNGHYLVGMHAPDYYFPSHAFGYKYGWKTTFTESISILKGLGKLLTGQWSQISGPIGSIEQTKNYIQSGAPSFFLYVATLSANLFVLNILPIPPLDGFKFSEIFIEMCIRKELNSRFKLFLSIMGAVLFLILFIGLTIKDLL